MFGQVILDRCSGLMEVDRNRKFSENKPCTNKVYIRTNRLDGNAVVMTGDVAMACRYLSGHTSAVPCLAGNGT